MLLSFSHSAVSNSLWPHGLQHSRLPCPSLCLKWMNEWMTYFFTQKLCELDTISCHFVAVVQSLSSVPFFATPWTATHQAPLSSSVSQSLLKLPSIESVKLSNHLIFCCSLLLLPSIFSSIRVFSNEPILHIRWPEVLELQLQHQSFQWTFRVDFL